MALSGKTALITGGGTGIGAASAVGLARAGCRVMIAGRREEKLRNVAATSGVDGQILCHAADVSRRDQVASLFDAALKELGQIDVLVMAAGVNVVKRKMAELSPEDWDTQIAINLTGAFNCIHAVLPHMRSRGDGLIISISSIAGKRASPLGGAAYSASKFGLHGLTHTLGAEEWKNGVRTCVIYPGEANTEILANRPEPVPEERKQRMLQGEDLAAAVVFVASLPPRACVPELVITPSYQTWT